MKQKKNNLLEALGILIGVGSLILVATNIHKVLALGSTASGKFYLICLVLCILISLAIIMYYNKQEAQKDNDILYEQITKEYKEHVTAEVKCIKWEIVALKESIEDVDETLKTTNKTILKTNERIDAVILKDK